MRKLVPVLLFLVTVAGPAPARPVLVHMLSGSAEYESEASLQAWASHLEEVYGIKSTFSLGTDREKSVEGLEHLKLADAMVVFCRRWELGDEQASLITSFIKSGKPILAIRTASHAFEFYKAFDSEILGGDYQGHGKGDEPMKVIPNSEFLDHPVLAGISPWKRTGKVYRNPNLAGNVRLLLKARLQDRTAPLAWIRVNREQRIFYTSMGLPGDFSSPVFVSLLDNALFWICRRSPR